MKEKKIKVCMFCKKECDEKKDMYSKTKRGTIQYFHYECYLKEVKK